LIHDITTTISDLDDLYNAHEEDFKYSEELKRAVSRLRYDMISFHERCSKLLTPERSGRLAEMRVKIRAYHKRDDIEDEIVNLKEQVNLCYAKFMVSIQFVMFEVLRSRSLGLLCRSRGEHFSQDRTSTSCSHHRDKVQAGASRCDGFQAVS
jgi:hypothetical protein